ncbi:ADP-ribosyl-(Dinitrogen reductase) hydrolase [Polynucleobacter antarcticus]|uniref:ADP-ribosyl-(Dinitrogen reductase) hydrolase n=1 Tax=Polynucleobacter antarcticus TaxID=1743162 RepID=A0A6M9PKI9_9BURK|nr:ADP-ribosyl-(dinitrogen reductase) hydrolase [Polynucleobacter antarcticus]
MNKLITSPAVLKHIWDKHQLSRVDVEECFYNHLEARYLEDRRAKNKTTPPTYWFISKNHQNLTLKIVCVFKEGFIYLKTIYPPNMVELCIYKNAK